MKPDRGPSDIEPAVISVARRDPVNVRAALVESQRLSGEPLARELVRIVIDADRNSIAAVLKQVGRIDGDRLRASTLCSTLDQVQSVLLRTLPKTAQDVVVRLARGLAAETARALALTRMPLEVPAELSARLVTLADQLTNPVLRLVALLHLESEPDRARRSAFIANAEAIEDEAQRGEAFGEVARVLDADELERIYTSAKGIRNPEVASRALVRIADRFGDSRQALAQAEILGMSSSIRDPIRRFGVIAALRRLPVQQRMEVETVLFDLAGEFPDASRRSRALFIAADYAEDQARATRALLAGIAAAERVEDEHARAKLFLLLRPGAPHLPTDVRRELTRAVERMRMPDVKRDLYSTLGRFFVYERPAQESPREAEGRARPARAEQVATYDLFISYSSKDTVVARDLARELQSRGMQVFLSADAMDAAVGSSSWIAAIDRALVASRALIVLITVNSIDSKWVEEEWGKYYQHIIETGAGRMLSLNLGGLSRLDLPPTLRRFQIIQSQTGRIEPGHLTRIIDIIRGR